MGLKVKDIIKNIRKSIVGLIYVILFVLSTGCIEMIDNYSDVDNTNYAPVQPYVPQTDLDKYKKLDYTPTDLRDAGTDYQWRLALVQEQTQRLDMYYAVKSGEFMSQREFKSWLVDIDLQTDEFVKRNIEAIGSGRNYKKYLNEEVENLEYDWYSDEYDRITKNEDIMKNDITIAVDDLYSNVNKYNSLFVK